MNLNFKILSFFILVFLASCEKVVKTYQPATPNLQVISAIQSIDSVAKCIISRTNTINDNSINYINEAIVYLYNDRNEIIDTLKPMGEGKYRGVLVLRDPGKIFKLVSIAKDFPDASCDFQFPEKASFEISNFIFRPNKDFFVNRDEWIYSTFNLSIADPPGENYYIVYDNVWVFGGDTTRNRPSPDLRSTNFAVTSECSNYNTNNHNMLYFSDKSFDGTVFPFDLDVLISGVSRDTALTQKYEYTITLMTISKSYYNFIKSFCDQENAQGFSGEGISYVYNLYPYTEVYSNIKGGTGTFSCYNKSTRKIVVEY